MDTTLSQKPKIPAKSTAAFKRESRRKHKEKKRQEKLQHVLEDWSPLTDHSRPAAPISPSTSVADWPLDSFTERHAESIVWNLNHRLLSPVAQQQPKASAESSAQEKGIRLCREFLSIEFGSDEENLEVDDRDCGKSYAFFKNLFDKESDLRDFYHMGYAKGEFYCLACGGIGEKLGKKFVGLAAVAQHANFISNTKSMMLHRAYGRVICELLGLEIDGIKGGVSIDDNAGDSDSQDEDALMCAVKDGVEISADA